MSSIGAMSEAEQEELLALEQELKLSPGLDLSLDLF